MENISLIATDTQAAIEAGKQLAMMHEPLMINGTPVFITPNNYDISCYDSLREYPQHIEQKLEHSSAQSFIDYYNRFANSDSTIFLNIKTHTFSALLDYHGTEHPDWCKHQSNFKLIKTPEWTAWENHSGKGKTQTEFGQFIEENLEEIITPSGAEMLEIALSMQANTKVKFSQATRLDNGQTSFSYVEDIEGKAGLNGSLKIPEKFTIGMQLFEGGDAYQMDARLRYRIKDGQLSIWYELIRPHKTVTACQDDTKNWIKEHMAQGYFYEELSQTLSK